MFQKMCCLQRKRWFKGVFMTFSREQQRWEEPSEYTDVTFGADLGSVPVSRQSYKHLSVKKDKPMKHWESWELRLAAHPPTDWSGPVT